MELEKVFILLSAVSNNSFLELPDISPLFNFKANATGALKQNAYTYIVDDNFASFGSNDYQKQVF